MTQQCTHVDCEAAGVGKLTDKSGHFLCQSHLDLLKDLMRRYHETQSVDDLKRMVGEQVRANGGAEAMTKRMGPAIDAASRMLEALRRPKS